MIGQAVWRIRETKKSFFQVLERVSECQKLLTTRNVGSTMLSHAKSLCESLETFNDAVNHVMSHIKVINLTIVVYDTKIFLFYIFIFIRRKYKYCDIFI